MAIIRILISGYNGRMGRVLDALARDDPEINVVAGIDINDEKTGDCPVYKNIGDFPDIADVVIDFSSPLSLESLLEYCQVNNTPLVLCATGYSSEQIEAIKRVAEHVAIFRSGNMSLGINLIIDLIKRACCVLGESFDVEIVESHHRHKIDAPSGTALMLAEAAASALPYEPEYIYDRQSRRSQRAMREIGISSLRGGTIVGEHEVIFAGLDEVISLKHSAASRDVFAVGALRAAKYMAGIKTPGMYDMRDVLI